MRAAARGLAGKALKQNAATSRSHRMREDSKWQRFPHNPSSSKFGARYATERKPHKTRETRDALKACTTLDELQRLHHSLPNPDERISKTLIDMYTKLGSMSEAHQIFEKFTNPTVGMWNSLIRGYVECGETNNALSFFRQMQKKAGIVPDSRLFVSILSKLASSTSRTECFRLVKDIHSQVTDSGHESNLYVSNALVDVYAKCGHMNYAIKVFERMAHRDTVSWNSIISGYVQNGQSHKALELFTRMRDEEYVPNGRTYLAVVKACGELKKLEKGREIHGMIGEDVLSDVFLANALIDMYAKCGNMENALEVFDTMENRTTVTWNSMISGYVENGESQMGLEFLELMKKSGFSPDGRTYVAAFQACSSFAEEEEYYNKGRKLHKEVSKSGYASNVYVASSLIEFYGRYEKMEKAREVFDGINGKDARLFKSLLAGYRRKGDGKKVLEVFEKMPEHIRAGVDAKTWMRVLEACSECGDVEVGKVAFENVVRVEQECERARFLMEKILEKGGIGESSGEKNGKNEKKDGVGESSGEKKGKSEKKDGVGGNKKGKGIRGKAGVKSGKGSAKADKPGDVKKNKLEKDGNVGTKERKKEKKDGIKENIGEKNGIKENVGEKDGNVGMKCEA